MQFERIRKSHKKETIIGGLVVLGIVSALTFTTSRARYKLTESIPLVSGSINYKPYDFKIMAIYQQNESGAYTEIDEMPSSGYVINEEKTYCTTNNQTQVKGKIKTIDGNVAISSLNKNDKCYLYFDKEEITSEDTLKKLKITPKEGTPDFSQVAESDEGVYKVEDGMYGGTSYYWRGAVTNNYVKFANFCWRIVRINGDGSLRLIYDGASCHTNGTNTAESIAKTSVAYNTSYNASYYVGWTWTAAQRPSTSVPQTGGTASNAKTQLESWYNGAIKETDASKVTDGKYCNDRNVESGQTWVATEASFNYAAHNRINAGAPTLSCPNGDIYQLKVGLITADEVEFAGGKNANTAYYLYNGQNYWTMSPRIWNGSIAYMFLVDRKGSLSYVGNVDLTTYGLRPVINLRSDITFASGGDGTLNSPYVVS